jgi:hypothetical protein
MSSDLTRLRVYERRDHQPPYAKCFRAAVSMRCHTSHSRKSLTFIPHYARRIPVISRFYESEMKRYGEKIDFARAWWTPPATARQVFEMETVEVESRLGLPAIVSITDHDDITAGLWLQSLDSQGRIPISVEWTVPYGRGYFHLGVHNLPPDRASELMREMSAYSQIDGQPRQRMDLRDLLAWITEFPETLVVLNHPQGQFLRTNRVFIDIENRGARPLSDYWKRGGPVWVRAALWGVRAVGSQRVKPALQMALSRESVLLDL